MSLQVPTEVGISLDQIRAALEGHRDRLAAAIQLVGSLEEPMGSGSPSFRDPELSVSAPRAIPGSPTAVMLPATALTSATSPKILPPLRDGLPSPPRAEARETKARIFADIEALLRSKGEPLSAAALAHSLNRDGHAVSPRDVYTLCQKRVISGKLAKHEGRGYSLP